MTNDNLIPTGAKVRLREDWSKRGVVIRQTFYTDLTNRAYVTVSWDFTMYHAEDVLVETLEVYG